MALQYVLEFQDGDLRTAPDAQYGIFAVEEKPIYNSLLISMRPETDGGPLLLALTISQSSGASIDLAVPSAKLPSSVNQNSFKLQHLENGVALLVNGQEVLRNDDADKGALAAKWWKAGRDAGGDGGVKH